MFLDDRGGVRNEVGYMQLLFMIFNGSVLWCWWVEGGITGHLLVAILDHSGYKTVTTRDLIGMFFVGVGMGWVWVK